MTQRIVRLALVAGAAAALAAPAAPASASCSATIGECVQTVRDALAGPVCFRLICV